MAQLTRRQTLTLQSLRGHFSTGAHSIERCRCDKSGRLVCTELGKIAWNKPDYSYLHYRFDGCICSDFHVNKCDCIIFRFQSGVEKVVMFVLETKRNDPKFTTAKKQIEYCIERMLDLVPNPKAQFAITPVICGKEINAHLKEAALSNKVKIFGKKKLIALRKYGQGINDAA